LRCFSANSEIELSVGRLVRGVFLITTVPVIAGMALRAFRPALADRLQGGISRVATALFVLIVVAFFVKERATIVANLATVGPAAASLVFVVMTAGIGLALAFRLGRRDGIAIASECGLQNAALGIFIATAVLATPALAVPSVIYALLMNVGALIFVFIARRWVGPAAVATVRA
jgi:bile acid:Na+ symporter, BASS family